MKLIRVVSKQDGSVNIETSGYIGKECLHATEDLEDDLGLDRSKRTLKPEYRQAVKLDRGIDR